MERKQSKKHEKIGDLISEGLYHLGTARGLSYAANCILEEHPNDICSARFPQEGGEDFTGLDALFVLNSFLLTETTKAYEIMNKIDEENSSKKDVG